MNIYRVEWSIIDCFLKATCCHHCGAKRRKICKKQWVAVQAIAQMAGSLFSRWKTLRWCQSWTAFWRPASTTIGGLRGERFAINDGWQSKLLRKWQDPCFQDAKTLRWCQSWTAFWRPASATIGGLRGERFAKNDGWWSKLWRKWQGGGWAPWSSLATNSSFRGLHGTEPYNDQHGP